MSVAWDTVLNQPKICMLTIELPIKLRAFNYEFQVERDVFGGVTRYKEEEETESEDGVWTLERVLEKSIQENYPEWPCSSNPGLLCVMHKQLW